MKIFIALGLLSATLMASMSIDKAWENVESKNEGVKASKSDVERAESKKEAAKSMYLPSVSLVGSYSHLSEAVKVEGDIDLSKLSIPLPVTIPYSADLSKQDVFLADLQLLLPLYVGGKIDAMQDIYKAQVSEKKALNEMKKDTEFLKLVKYYYGVVVSKSLYETRVQAQKALQIHYGNAQKLKAQGQIAKIELLNAEVKLDSAKTETRSAEHKLHIAKSALTSLTKSTHTPTSKLFVNENMREKEHYEKETKESYAGLKIIDAKTSQTASIVKIKEAAWLPKVAAFGNYNLYKDDSVMMQTLPKWFVGVMVKIDLIKRSDRTQEIQAAKLLNDKLKYLKAEAVEKLALLVEKSYLEMVAAKEEFNSLSSSLALADENYRLRTVAFNEGLSTSVELVDAQMFLLGAKTKRLNAAYNFVQKVSQLTVLSGDREMFFNIANSSEEIE